MDCEDIFSADRPLSYPPTSNPNILMKHLVPLLLAMVIYPTLSTHLEARMQVNEQTEAIQLATRKGKVYGRGKTKGDAYADAAGKIPNGSTPGKSPLYRLRSNRMGLLAGVAQGLRG